MAMTPATECGIPSIGKVAWGSHFCHFYRKRDDLVHALVPYFQAGLANNERCLWITSEPFRAEDAIQELRRVLPEVDSFLEQGRIKIQDFDRWYTSTAGVREDVVARWLEEEQAALDAGYAGLRISGNTSFLEPAQWSAFMKYEGEVNRTFAGRRIVALCSYDLKKSKASNVFDAIRNHRFTLDRKDDSWEIVESAIKPFGPSTDR